MLKMIAHLKEMLAHPKEMLAHLKEMLALSKHLDHKLQMHTSAWRDTARDFHNHIPLRHLYNSNLRVF